VHDKRACTDPERAELKRDQLHSIPSGQTSMSNEEIDSRGGRMGGVKSQVNEQRDRVTNRYASENEQTSEPTNQGSSPQGFSPPERQGIRVNREHGLGSLRTDELNQTEDQTTQNSSAVN